MTQDLLTVVSRTRLQVFTLKMWFVAQSVAEHFTVRTFEVVRKMMEN